MTIRELLEAAHREEWLAVREVAVALRLSEKTGYRRCREGSWPARKHGGTWRVHRSVFNVRRVPRDSGGQQGTA